jgi:two-component system KDP operon response regulator KdpE
MLDLIIGQLRQEIEEDPDDPKIILTELGIGYRIAEGDARLQRSEVR